MGTTYNVVFEGKLVPGKTLEEVKKALASVLNREVQTVGQLFSGRPVVLRKQVDAATAEKYQKRFRAAGAICALKALEGGTEAAAAADCETKSAVPKTPSATASSRRSASPRAEGILLTNIETVPGRSIVAHFGLVSGSTIRAKHIGKDLMAGFKNLVGGELKAYTELLQESRQEATERMAEQARQLGANAVVNVRYSTSSVAAGAAEIYAYGTAVCVE
jgi:uncharacterized protein YbjQ (UPF0145 family)